MTLEARDIENGVLDVSGTVTLAFLGYTPGEDVLPPGYEESTLAQIAANTAARHTHPNKPALDAKDTPLSYQENMQILGGTP
jgi:hypothetical protein